MKENLMEHAVTWLNVPTPFQQTGGMYIIRAGMNCAKPNYFIGPRMILYYSLHFVLEGTVVVEQGESRYVLSKGDIFCLYPFKSYVYKTAGEELPLRMAWLAMEGHQVSQLVRKSGFREHAPFVRNIMNSRVRGTLRQIQQCLESDLKDELYLQSLMYKMFSQLTLPQNRISQRSDKNWIHESIKYIENHFSKNLKIEDVALWAGMNRSYFSSMFAKEVGMSPRRFVMHLRMNQGKRLLQESQLSVTEIALSLGYSDLYSFTRAFSGWQGMSPSQYRTKSWHTDAVE